MSIANDIPIPEESTATKPKRSRARSQAAGTKKAAASPVASLIAALKFISIAQKKAGPPGVQFSIIRNHWIAAFNGVLTVATQIEEDLSACPHTLQLIDALSKVENDVSITQLTETALAVSSGAFRALVPCAAPDDLYVPPPDPQCAVIDDRVKAALAAVAGLATEGAPSATFAAVLLQANSAVATNGSALLEAWHGVDLPPGLLLPKVAASAIAKCSKALVGFGFDQEKWSSATFYFEDGSFIKTQLYGERYPNYAPLIEVENLNLWSVPADFYVGIRALQAFSQSGNVFFEDGNVLSKQYKEEASTYKIEGLPERMGFNIKFLIEVEHAFKQAHFMPDAGKVVFYGENIRGVLMGIDLKDQASYAAKSEEEFIESQYDSFEDDIPF